MESVYAMNQMNTIQEALKVITALQLTAYLWPQQAHVQNGASFDFIIVGAGTAGCVIANRLTENSNINVLLVEAGGDPPLESHLPGLYILMKRSHCDWNYTSEYDNYIEKCHRNPYFEMTLGKILGGTSSSNHMIYSRGNEHGYTFWAAAGEDDTWLWKNVLPYFKKLEKIEDSAILNSSEKYLFGTDGYVPITKGHRDLDQYLDAFKENGHAVRDINGKQSLGYSRMMLTYAQGSRQSTALAYLSSIKNRPNLYVLKNSLVTKILFDDNKNAVGVIVITKDGKTITLKASKEVIISAGVFNSAKLLMLSGIGPEYHLKSKNINIVSNLPVGENLMDYLCALLIFNMQKLEKPLPPKDPHELPAPGISGFIATNKSQDYPDYHYHDIYSRK